MTRVIRIDNEVMEELKKRAIEFGMVFEPPNMVLRKVLGLAPRSRHTNGSAAPTDFKDWDEILIEKA